MVLVQPVRVTFDISRMYASVDCLSDPRFWVNFDWLAASATCLEVVKVYTKYIDKQTSRQVGK